MLCTQSIKRPQVLLNASRKPVSAFLVRHQTTIDRKHEQEIAQQKLKADPEHVSSKSSVHPLFSEVATEQPDKDVDMGSAIRSDLVDIQQDTTLMH